MILQFLMLFFVINEDTYVTHLQPLKLHRQLNIEGVYYKYLNSKLMLVQNTTTATNSCTFMRLLLLLL